MRLSSEKESIVLLQHVDDDESDEHRQEDCSERRVGYENVVRGHGYSDRVLRNEKKTHIARNQTIPGNTNSPILKIAKATRRRKVMCYLLFRFLGIAHLDGQRERINK